MIINDPQYKPFTDEDMIVYKGAYSTDPVKTPPITDYDMLKEYSEEPDKLMELLSQIKVSIERKGVQKMYFNEEDEPREIVAVTMNRDGREITFDFGLSLKDTDTLANKPNSERRRVPYKDREEIWSGLLYTVLACCSCDYFIPTSLTGFCEELGYDINDKRTQGAFIRCKEQQAKIEQIFSEDEIPCLPQ
tara:strand:- start:1449 stop:2021 length:573 start_codon:yes stop_codon:yes gene_type:complete